MTIILKTVLENMDSTENAMDSYSNDILVENTAMPVASLAQ